jgi:hypothetical protein
MKFEKKITLCINKINIGYRMEIENHNVKINLLRIQFHVFF